MDNFSRCFAVNLILFSQKEPSPLFIKIVFHNMKRRNLPTENTRLINDKLKFNYNHLVVP